jgi:NAD+ diphosphatase
VATTSHPNPNSHPPSPAFTGMALDRVDTERRDLEWVASRLADPGARMVLADRDNVLLSDETVARLAVEDDVVKPARAILLGLEGEHGIFALDLETLDFEARARIESHGRLATLREAGSLLPEAEGGLAAYLVALLNWHRRHGFCANCGNVTEIAEAGGSRRCPRCGANHFPRTDPVVIMTVEHDDRLLLGRRRGWPAGRYSVLAGFVSPGETAEAAVVREVREESGLEAFAPRYVTSQPWPFPASLMLGFDARSTGGEPRTLDGELEDVGWFDGDAVAAAMARSDNGEDFFAPSDGGLALPPPVSIAHALIARWVARRAATA